MIQNIELFYREGSSDKVYKASITETPKGFEVNFAYGRRGNALTTGTKTTKPVPLDQAQKIYNKLVQEKTAKGYIEDPQGKPFTGTVTEARDTGIRPQLLNEIEEGEVDKYLNDDNWCAQEKFDGRRRLLIMQDNVVTATNRKGLSIAIDKKVEVELLNNRVPELKHYALDGEDLGSVIVLFDILIIGQPYKDRYKLLKQMFNARRSDVMITMKLAPTAWTTKEKKALYERLKKDNAEGIVFKNINAGFIPGRPSSGGDQLKFKFCSTASVLVVKTNPEKRSVQVAVFDAKENKIEVGNVTVYPNQQIPTPGTIVEVRYLYYFPGGSLFQPVLLGERDDMAIEDCTLSQLKEKRETVEL